MTALLIVLGILLGPVVIGMIGLGMVMWLDFVFLGEVAGHRVWRGIWP